MDRTAQRITIVGAAGPDGSLTIAVSGDLAVETAPTFLRHLDEFRRNHPGAPLNLDLSAVRFCDLTGLRALHTTGVQYQARIIAASDVINTLLKICQIPTLLDYTPPRPSRNAG